MTTSYALARLLHLYTSAIIPHYSDAIIEVRRRKCGFHMYLWLRIASFWRSRAFTGVRKLVAIKTLS